MQSKHSLLAALLVFMAATAFAQTTYLPLWAKESQFLDRLEIKSQTNNDLNLSTVKPYMRKVYVAVADSLRGLLRQGQNPVGLSAVDQYNLDRLQANSREYSQYNTDSMPQWLSKKSWGKYIFPTKGNLLEVNEKDFYLSVVPVIGVFVGKEANYENKLFINSRGAAARGLIAKKVAFQFYLTDNQEQGPAQFRNFVNTNRAVPGNGFWKRFKDDPDNGVDYFDARGSISSSVTKYVNVQFGYDKNFIGNGYRSLYLSDFGTNYLFLKLNTRIWKLNYTNLFMELTPTYYKRSDTLLPKKYASMHHLSVNVTKWLNIGLFESIMFGRTNHYEFAYLNPVIFLRSIEQQNGSPDNANVGMDIKANLLKKVQLYGQLMLDELSLAKIRKDPTWWANKTGLQLGAKYVDAFGLNNLDIQVELNRIRPFTYQHNDSTASYTHYQQPLAHPRGANLQELIGIVRYQPINKLYLLAKAIYTKQGLDSLGRNFGANPLQLYTTRTREYGYKMFAGVPATTLYANFVASYEMYENLFIELNASMRQFKMDKQAAVKNNTISLGLRWNIFRREYDY